MQVQIIGKHHHADVTISIKVPVDTDVLVHVIPGVLHHVMDVKTLWAASQRVVMRGGSRIDEQERHQKNNKQNSHGFSLHSYLLEIDNELDRTT